MPPVYSVNFSGMYTYGTRTYSYFVTWKGVLAVKINKMFCSYINIDILKSNTAFTVNIKLYYASTYHKYTCTIFIYVDVN